MKRYQEFRFVVEEMTDEQAEELMKKILAHVDELGLWLGGGYKPTTDENYPDQGVRDGEKEP